MFLPLASWSHPLVRRADVALAARVLDALPADALPQPSGVRAARGEGRWRGCVVEFGSTLTRPGFRWTDIRLVALDGVLSVEAWGVLEARRERLAPPPYRPTRRVPRAVEWLLHVQRERYPLELERGGGLSE